MARKSHTKPNTWFKKWAIASNKYKEYIAQNGFPSVPPQEYPKELITPENPLFAYRYCPRMRFDTDDYHAWVEDDDGNIIYDPRFVDELKKKCAFPLDIDFNKPVNKKWNESERKKVKEWLLSYDKIRREYEDEEYVINTFYDNPQHLRCFWNATAYVYKHKTGNVVFGSAGFQCANGGEFFTSGMAV